MVNTDELLKKIKDSGKSKSFLARKLCISRACLYNKLSGNSEFTTNEVAMLCEELGITRLREKEQIFFSN